MREVPERPQFILTEDENDTITYQFKYIFNNFRFEEEAFKQKLSVALKSMNSISNSSLIPEVVDVIVHGLREGSKESGIAYFNFGSTQIKVQSKKVHKIVAPMSQYKNSPKE